uniref:DUF7774 domain-containing protein n=1 Tax=Panagrolaimus superbus TaxID=310955 RepID=A0A914YP74_9BILA
MSDAVDKAGTKSNKSAGGRSDTDLQHLRAKFHATQFRFTSALAAEHGKASDGAFRIQLKSIDNLKPTKLPPKDIYEPIETFENEEGLKDVEAKEPEYDMFGGSDSSSDESGLMEEWDPAFIAEIQKKCNIRWREAVMEEDPLTDKDELQAIRKRRAEEIKAKENKKKEEIKHVKVAEAISRESGIAPATSSPSLSKESLDHPHAPAFSPGALPSAEPLIPATNIHHLTLSQEALGLTLSKESLLPNAIESESKQNVTTTKKCAEPLFDCLDSDIVLDDSNLSDITNGLKEGMTYDNALVTDDLKKKLLEIDANKEKVEAELIRKALEREDTPVKTDATANKIVEALTDYEVIAKTVAVEDSKMLKEYFDGSRKADDEVIAALDRVIDRILDRAADFYSNKEELALFLRNRGTAKSNLLDAMLSRKGGWLQNMYGSAYSTALAIYSGANKTVEVVGKGLAAAKDVAGQSATMARDYAATTVDVVNRSYTKANELAEQSATVAREVATKGSEMYSKAADVASYSTEQARRVASVTALFAGKVSSVVSTASSLASSSSTTSTSSVTGTSTTGSSTTEYESVPSTAATSTSDVSALPSTSSSSTVESQTGETGSTTNSSLASATGSGADESKSTDEEEKTLIRNPSADSPVPLTFNGFMHCPSPPKPTPAPKTESIFTTIWKTLTEVSMAAYGGNPLESRESSKEEEPPKEDKSKKD